MSNSLLDYYVIENHIQALEHTEANQPTIIKILSDAVIAGEIVDLNTELAKTTDRVYSITFRQKSETQVKSLTEGQYFIKNSAGFTVSDAKTFTATYSLDESETPVLDAGVRLRS